MLISYLVDIVMPKNKYEKFGVALFGVLMSKMPK